MVRVRRPAVTAEILNNARAMASVIKRLNRGNHITLKLSDDKERIEQMVVSEVAREVLNAHGVSTSVVGFHRKRHRHRVKLGIVFERDGTVTKDSLDAVLANAKLFKLAMEPVMARAREGAYPHVERRAIQERRQGPRAAKSRR